MQTIHKVAGVVRHHYIHNQFLAEHWWGSLTTIMVAHVGKEGTGGGGGGGEFVGGMGQD